MSGMTQAKFMAEIIKMIVALPEELVKPFEDWLLATARVMSAKQAYEAAHKQGASK